VARRAAAVADDAVRHVRLHDVGATDGTLTMVRKLAESLYRAGYRDGVMDRSPSKDHDDYMTGWEEGQSQHKRDAALL
jgi:hypothetical protein